LVCMDFLVQVIFVGFHYCEPVCW